MSVGFTFMKVSISPFCSAIMPVFLSLIGLQMIVLMAGAPAK